MLSMIEFVYNNVRIFLQMFHSIILCMIIVQRFYYKVENDFIEKKISSTKNKIKHLHEIKKRW